MLHLQDAGIEQVGLDSACIPGISENWHQIPTRTHDAVSGQDAPQVAQVDAPAALDGGQAGVQSSTSKTDPTSEPEDVKIIDSWFPSVLIVVLIGTRTSSYFRSPSIYPGQLCKPPIGITPQQSYLWGRRKQ